MVFFIQLYLYCTIPSPSPSLNKATRRHVCLSLQVSWCIFGMCLLLALDMLQWSGLTGSLKISLKYQGPSHKFWISVTTIVIGLPLLLVPRHGVTGFVLPFYWSEFGERYCEYILFYMSNYVLLEPSEHCQTKCWQGRTRKRHTFNAQILGRTRCKGPN